VPGFTKIRSILCRFAFLVLLSSYSPVPINVACAFEFPQTMKVSVKSNAFGLHAGLKCAKEYTAIFNDSNICLSVFYWFAGPPVWTNPRIRKMCKRFVAEPAGNTMQFKCLPNAAPPKNAMVQKQQTNWKRSAGWGYGVLICNNHRMFFIWDSKYDRGIQNKYGSMNRSLLYIDPQGSHFSFHYL